jgi:cell division inhibitor SepF
LFKLGEDIQTMERAEKAGIFSKIAGVFSKSTEEDVEEIEYERNPAPLPANQLKLRTANRYQVTVRRQILSFQDAVSAADGLKRGEQQILNLTQTDPVLRDKIKDFLCGVNYAHEGAWEEVGDNIYLLAPMQAFVEVAPASPRMKAMRN